MTEELVGSKGESLEDVWLMSEPGPVHAGCLSSTATVVLAAIEALIEAWHLRKDDPLMLVQPAGQWTRVLEEPTLNFHGYGHPLPLPKAGSVRVSPDTGRRMQASGLFDPGFWGGD